MITIDELLNKDNLLSLMVPYFNVASDEDDEYFYVRSVYRGSQRCIPTSEEMEENNQLLREQTELPFHNESSKSQGKHTLKIKKTDEIFDRQQLFDVLNRAIQMKRLFVEPEIFERDLLLSLFTLRGSIDCKVNYFAVDVLDENKTQEYLYQLLNLLTSISDIKQLNFNFRELQEQYVTGEQQRNAQIRINLRWFYDRYDNDLRRLNVYKYRIMTTHNELIETFRPNQQLNAQFIERIQFYMDNVYESLAKDDHISVIKGKVSEYRTILNFKETKESQDELQRSSSIRQLAVALLPEECVGCKDDYPLENRTFKYRNGDRYYLEVHHVIAFSSDRAGDQLDNLVKLCPTCHRALTKGRAEEKYQKYLIKNILKNDLRSKRYVGLLMEEPYTLEDQIQFVYEKLK